jgi:predicted nucleotidyltransferase
MPAPIKVDSHCGLSERIIGLLRTEIARFPEVRAAYLYGSRARGDYTPQSDIDIAIDAPGITQQKFAQIWSAIDATPIAYPLDCVWLQALPESALRAQITRDGRVF